MAQQTKSTLTQAAQHVTPEDLDDLRALEAEFEDRITKAYENGRTYMMLRYTSMLAGIKVDIKRIAARMDREVMAAHRAAAKALKLEQKASAQTAKDNA